MKFVMYSKDGCDYCDKARDFLRSQGKELIEYKLGKDFSREMLKEVFPQAPTYPVITVNGEYLGGCTELIQKYGGK